MSLFAPSPPPDHYEWLGKVMNAASMLELQIGLIGWAFQNGAPYTEDWASVAGAPGAAWRRCEDQLDNMSAGLGADVQNLLVQAAPLRPERNKFAHAVFILDPERAAGDQWVLKSARDPEFRPLTRTRGEELVSKANRLSRMAQGLRMRAAKEGAGTATKSAP